MEDVAATVAPGLYISGMPSPQWDLDAWGVALVVSLSDHLPPQAARRFEWGTRGDAVGEGRLLFTHWPIEDGDLPELGRLHLVVSLVAAAARSGLRVLVHCQEGRNRSGLVAALVVRELTGCSGARAVEVVRAARPGMLGNRAFADFITPLPALSGHCVQPSAPPQAPR